MTGCAELLEVFGRKQFTVADARAAQINIYFAVGLYVKRERSAISRTLFVNPAAVLAVQKTTEASLLGQEPISAANLVTATEAAIIQAPEENRLLESGNGFALFVFN